MYLQEKVNEWRKETVRPIYECAFETNKTDISAIFNDYLWEVIRCAPNSEEIVTKLNGYI